MSESKFSFELPKGTSRVVLWPVAVEVNGKPSAVDLVGATAVAEVRQGANLPVLIRLESEGSDPRITFDGHYIRLDFLPEHTANASWGNALIDVLLTLRNGTVMRTAVAEVVLNHGITQA